MGSNTTDSHSHSLKSIPEDSLRGDGHTWTAGKERIVLGPYEYLMDKPGKDIRSQMIGAFNAWLKVPDDRLAIINKVIGMLHTSSLLIDDIEDSSNLRRGIPVAHHIFGNAQTLNSANYVYFLALQELLKLGNPKFTSIYSEELCALHRGQGMDLYWRDTLTCPTEEDYIEMVGNKTGGLFRLAVKLMQAESPAHNPNPSETPNNTLVPLVNLLGIIFQIRDDYLNLWSATYTDNKGLCEDLTEGKFSFPIIHAIRADPSNAQLINILRQKPTDPEVKRYAVEYMERMGSFEYCRQAVKVLVERAERMIEEYDAGRGEGGGVRNILGMFVLD